MEWSHITSLTQHLAWPVTVVVLALAFRRELVKVIGRLDSAKLPGGTQLSFGTATVDKEDSKRPAQDEDAGTNSLDRTKVGNIYWLGYDLMWTVDALLRGAPGLEVRHGIRQALHHLTQLGGQDTSAGQKLRQLYDQVRDMTEADWHARVRNRFSVDIRDIADEVGVSVESMQPKYMPRPITSA